MNYWSAISITDAAESYKEFMRSLRGSQLTTPIAALGLCGEAGEVAELIKKDAAHGVPAEREKVLKECGDVLFYLAVLLDDFGYTLEDALDGNVRKLQARYPNGFVNGGGIR